MELLGKEHYEIMAAFERSFPQGRKDKEDKELWEKGNIYQDGDVNRLFLAFRCGVSYGLSVELN